MKENLSWKYRRWFVWIALTDLVLLTLMAVVMIKIQAIGNWIKSSPIYLVVYAIIIVIVGVAYFALLTKAIFAMERIDNDSRYQPYRDKMFHTQVKHIFTGKDIRSSSVSLNVFLLYPIAAFLFTLKFKSALKKDKKLQIKCKTKEKYQETKKRVVRRNIEGIEQELALFEMATWPFLIIYGIFVVLSVMLFIR